MVNLLKFDLLFLACSIFCALNVYILINDGRKAVYQTKETDINTTHISLCIDLGAYHCSGERCDGEYKACMKLHDLVEFFKQGDKSPREIIAKAKNSKLEEFFGFSREVRNVSYYMNFRSICLAYTVEAAPKANESEYANIELFNHHHVNSKIIFHDKMPVPFITRGYYFECKQFESCLSFTVTIKRFNLILLPKPFSSACKNYSRLKFNFTNTFEPIISRPFCLMECLKQNHRLSRFYYSENDTKILNYSKNYVLRGPMKSVKTEYLKCLEICESLDCETNNYFIFGIKFENSLTNHVLIRHHRQVMTYKATPVSNLTF